MWSVRDVFWVVFVKCFKCKESIVSNDKKWQIFRSCSPSGERFTITTDDLTLMNGILETMDMGYVTDFDCFSVVES